MTTVPEASKTRVPVAPSWRWALRRAVFGLTVMLAVTGLAAYLAHASIEPVAEPAPAIAIGTPAAAMLKTE